MSLTNNGHHIDPQKARNWANLLLKVISMPAIVVGGAWAYYQFSTVDTAVPNIQLTISIDNQRYSDGLRGLFIHVKPRNIGKVPIEIKPGKESFVVTVRKGSNNVGQSALDMENLPEFYKADFMKLFPDGYLLEPDAEHDEVLALVAPKGSYAIKAMLKFGGNGKVDQTVFARI